MTPDEVTYQFRTDLDAIEFAINARKGGLVTSSLQSDNRITVEIWTYHDRDQADALALANPAVVYKFGKRQA